MSGLIWAKIKAFRVLGYSRGLKSLRRAVAAFDGIWAFCGFFERCDTLQRMTIAIDEGTQLESWCADYDEWVANGRDGPSPSMEHMSDDLRLEAFFWTEAAYPEDVE